DGRENEKRFTKGISRSRGDELFFLDVAHAESIVNKQAGVYGLELNQDQFDALVSFTYNVGSGNLSTMLKSCEKGSKALETDKIPACMKRYDRAGGRISPGLTRRRLRVADLFEGKAHE
uniref:lysozyme n=1 Tax=uncultured Limnobacter sp. TaxID=199681 RepID=UPI0030FA1E00